MENTTIFVKQHSSLPEVKFPLKQNLLEEYDITDDMMGNVGVTFSMIDIDTGFFKIANAAAKLVVIDDDPDRLDDHKYSLQYRLNTNQTIDAGRYWGEFKLDFLGDYCGKISFPNKGELKIIVPNSITKTSVDPTPVLYNIFDDTFDITFN